MDKAIILSLTIMIISLFACNNKEHKVNEKKSDTNKTQNLIVEIPQGSDTVLTYKYDCCFIVTTNIMYPDTETDLIGCILMLHGWNLPADEWCAKTTFCEKALKQGYVLIIPDYKKANYTLEIYPQTIADYQKYPTITWIMETQIPDIQNQLGLLKPGQNTMVAGISTGARGATLLAYYMPELFKGAASLSGDFDITSMQDEYLYYSFLGHYSDFPERWKKECFAYDCNNYVVPTYIGHGKADNVSPYIQSKAMYDSIHKYHPELKLVGNFPDYAGHNYDYWESETDKVLDFFKCCK
ncbi:MAG: alpha/beta hydrolase-fold protein [Bacteroidales bacterium]|nr:alpha/beta hydrolase-fold protein [Bacteroidales bacterium]